MESNTSANKQHKLCENCFDFYGNAANDNLCSKCYKEKHKQYNQEIALNKKPSPNLTIDVDQAKAVNIDPEKLIQKAKEDEQKHNQIQQTDTTKCWSCQKKVNLLGIKCKCGFTFCSKHRLPEEHNCNIDFGSIGREQLKKANPVIEKKKLEQI